MCVDALRLGLRAIEQKSYVGRELPAAQIRWYKARSLISTRKLYDQLLKLPIQTRFSFSLFCSVFRVYKVTSMLVALRGGAFQYGRRPFSYLHRHWQPVRVIMSALF